MIDLAALRRSAAREDAGDAVVTRDWLNQVEQEITAGRVAQAQLLRVSAITAAELDIAAPLERRAIQDKDKQ